MIALNVFDHIFFFFALKNNSLVHVIYWTLEMLAIFSKLHVCLLVRSVL